MIIVVVFVCVDSQQLQKDQCGLSRQANHEVPEIEKDKDGQLLALIRKEGKCSGNRGTCFTHHSARGSVLTRGSSLSLNTQTQAGELMRILETVLICNITLSRQYGYC